MTIKKFNYIQFDKRLASGVWLSGLICLMYCVSPRHELVYFRIYRTYSIIKPVHFLQNVFSTSHQCLFPMLLLHVVTFPPPHLELAFRQCTCVMNPGSLLFTCPDILTSGCSCACGAIYSALIGHLKCRFYMGSVVRRHNL